MLPNINNFRIRTEIIKQFKDLDIKSNRIFFSAYGKLFKKIQAILKEKKLSLKDVSFEELLDLEYDLEISFSHDEIKELMKNNRLQKPTIENLIDRLIRLHLKVTDIEEDKVIVSTIFNNIVDDRKNKRIYFEFNESILKILYALQAGEFINIEYGKLIELKDNYQLNFYLYCLTIIRENGSGIVTRKLNDLRNELAGAFNYEDRLFYSRFINIPAKEINNMDIFGLDIKVKRLSENITISVKRR